MTTYSMKASEINKEWFVIDATDLVTGRLAVVISTYLRGKHKPTYTAHMDCGDYIIVVNADKVAFTGNKADRQIGAIHYKHTGYMGGLKETTTGKILEGKFPERVLIQAVRRMLGKNKLGNTHLKNLYVYAGPEHPHQAQQPKVLDVAVMNPKNKRN